MSKILVDQKRILTMREVLGEASALVNNDKYLPLFRNRQKNYAKEFKQAVKLSRSKMNPGRWFASIWSAKNTKKTLEILRAYINRKVAAQAKKREQSRKNFERGSIASNVNEAGRDKYHQMMIDRGLLTSR